MPTTIYTGQIGKIRPMLNARIIDSTIKTGRLEVAPTWEIVMGVKAWKACMVAKKPLTPNCISIEEYTRIYTGILHNSFQENEKFFMELLREEEVVFTCYCNMEEPGIKFCHRTVLAKELWEHASAMGYDVTLGGEL